MHKSDIVMRTPFYVCCTRPSRPRRCRDPCDWRSLEEIPRHRTSSRSATAITRRCNPPKLTTRRAPFTSASGAGMISYTLRSTRIGKGPDGLRRNASVDGRQTPVLGPYIRDNILFQHTWLVNQYAVNVSSAGTQEGGSRFRSAGEDVVPPRPRLNAYDIEGEDRPPRVLSDCPARLHHQRTRPNQRAPRSRSRVTPREQCRPEIKVPRDGPDQRLQVTVGKQRHLRQSVAPVMASSGDPSRAPWTSVWRRPHKSGLDLVEEGHLRQASTCCVLARATRVVGLT
ncbi:unnamed protein product [Trichogramma brassicae]|uniref:Uncharacterized protein n=1 Tax=Trichogramma brassicae TaxID=86971 RepID=A0A6H5HU81_9HYME|nr:unnamed protein product [Trichogramma brassicae]